MPKVLLSDRLYLPRELVARRLLDQFRYVWREHRYEYVLDDEGLVVMENGRQKTRHETVEHTIQAYEKISPRLYAFPRGDLKLLKPVLKRVVDRRGVHALDVDLKLLSSVTKDKRWRDQKRCIKEWARAGASGIILGTTGAGKTILGIGATIKLQQQTLVLSKRGDGERHWEGEFRQHTNIDALEREWGRRLIGPYKHKKPYEIAIGTVQTFLHEKGRARLEQDRSRFGLVIADEIDELVAPQFWSVLQQWNPLAWLGLTATIDREDHREFLAYRTVGPVVARLKANQMKPKAAFIDIPFSVPAWMEGRKPFRREWKWGKLLELLCGSEPSIRIMVHWIMQDIDDGKLVAVLAERLALARDLFDRLRQGGYDVAYVDGGVPNIKREQIYHELANGVKYRCICAGMKTMDKMVSIKPLNCLHIATPVSGRRRIMQIFGRTRRLDGGKPIPLVRYYAGHGGQLSGAYRNVLKVCQTEGWAVQHIDAHQASPLPFNRKRQP